MSKLFTLIFLAAFLIPLLSCSISLKKNQANLVTEIPAHNTAYLFAKKNPTEANELLQGPLPRFLDALTEDTATQVFNSFSSTLLSLTVKDPMLRTSFQALLTLIEIDIEGQDPPRSLEIVYDLLTQFLNGLISGTTK